MKQILCLVLFQGNDPKCKSVIIRDLIFLCNYFLTFFFIYCRKRPKEKKYLKRSFDISMCWRKTTLVWDTLTVTASRYVSVFCNEVLSQVISYIILGLTKLIMIIIILRPKTLICQVQFFRLSGWETKNKSVLLISVSV